MKKITFVLLIIVAVSKLQAQNYEIIFEGEGATTIVDTVHVQNLTQGTSLTLDGSEVLLLSGTVGIEQLSAHKDKSIHIYPNPMSTNSTIEFEISRASSVSVEIYDNAGKRVTSIQNNLQIGLHTYSISELNRGAYTVNVKSDHYIYSGKIISLNSTNGIANISYIGSEITSGKSALKSNKEVITMQYDEGDLLHFLGISGDFVTVTSLIPTSDSTVTFNFVDATDADGNNYGTITLGTQTWMLENLKTTTFNDGEAITEWTFGNDWFYQPDPVAYYQWAVTGDLNNLYEEELPFDFYGAIYNEASLASGKLAPIGWRIPTEQDFIELENFISNNGHLGNEATVLKSSYGWVPSIGNGTDLYGFNGLPNGYVSAGGTATGAQVICAWATSDNPTSQTRRIVNLFDETIIVYFDNSILLGAGVRCIKE